MHSGRGPGDGPPQQELALLAIGTLQQDILSYLRRHPQSTATEWLEDSGKRGYCCQKRHGNGHHDAFVCLAGIRVVGSVKGVVSSPRSRPTSPSGMEGAAWAYSSPSRKDLEQQIGHVPEDSSSSSRSDSL